MNLIIRKVLYLEQKIDYLHYRIITIIVEELYGVQHKQKLEFQEIEIDLMKN